MNIRTRCDRTQAWSALQNYWHTRGCQLDLRLAFTEDPERFARFSVQAPHIFADLSKNLIDTTSLKLLLDLAEQSGLKDYRDAMFAGDLINQSEARPALHVLLRKPTEELELLERSTCKTIATASTQIRQERSKMLDYAEQVRSNTTITDVVNLGIGGSDLGPRMAVQALGNTSGKRLHWVSNIDGYELASVLQQLRPESTLFVVASKSFTTPETLLNANTARQWLQTQGVTNWAAHFVALTAGCEQATRWGVTRILGLWDWVGGRYSLCSSVGLLVAIALGRSGFEQLLAGAHAMDEHFHITSLERNLPVLLGLLDLWYRNFYNHTSRSIAPYDSRLHHWPTYLQQLEMESNGKHVDAHGDPLPFATAPVVWGETGVNGQHAYFQMLHQGSDVIPVEFIAIAHIEPNWSEHHNQLLINALAQARALMQGCPDTTGHQHFAGNRPSTFLLFDELTPASLGALIALHEHRVFTSGALWGINSFDQWGVELGKVLARDLTPRLRSGDTKDLDSSTSGLLERLRLITN